MSLRSFERLNQQLAFELPHMRELSRTRYRSEFVPSPNHEIHELLHVARRLVNCTGTKPSAVMQPRDIGNTVYAYGSPWRLS